MDSKLSSALASAVNSSSSTIGVVVGDNIGLTISSEGHAAPGVAAYAASLLQRASMLNGVAADDGARAGHPVVRIETDQSYVRPLRL